MKPKSTLHRKMLFFLMLFLSFNNLLDAQVTQAPCNTYSPLITATYPGVSVTSSQTALVDDFAPKANVIDADLTNSATWNYIASSSAWIEVKDNNAAGTGIFPGGTYAGFVIDDVAVADFANNIIITTYEGATLKESASGPSLFISVLTTGKKRVGFVTTQSFDRIRVTFNGISAAGSANVYYAELIKFCTAAALVCNTPTYLTQPSFPVFVDVAHTGLSGGACAGCAVTAPENVIDGDPANSAQITITAGATAIGSIAIKAQLTSYPANTFAGFDIQNASLLNGEFLGNITITLLNNGTIVQTGTGNSQLVNNRTTVVNGSDRTVVGIVANVPFNEVKISINNTVNVNAGTTNVFGVVVQSGCAGTAPCEATTFLNLPLYPVIIEGSRTGINNPTTCAGCSVNNPENVISASTSDSAQIILTAGGFNSGSISVRDLITVYPAGSTTGFIVKDPNGFLEANLFTTIKITTYLNGSPQDSATSTQLQNLNNIITFGDSTTGKYSVGFTTGKPWNEVRITFNNTMGGLNLLEVFSAFVDTRNVPYGTPGYNCNYTNPDINVTYVNVTVNGNVSTNDKIQAGTTYGTPTVPPGVTNPSGTMPTVNADGTYSFTPTAVGVYQFYVPVCNGICTNELLTITVLDPAAAATNPPVANTDIATTKMDANVTIKSLANDAPGTPGFMLVASSTVVTDLNGPKTGNTSAGGTATVNSSNGDITYNPAAGFIGTDTIRYTVCDNQATPQCASGYQIITVTPTTAPNSTVAADDYVTTANVTAVSGNVSTNDMDPEGQAQVVTTQNISNAQGTFVLNADGSFTYAPAAGVTGPVEFAYTTCESTSPFLCTSATLHILVQMPGSVLPVAFSEFNASVTDCNTNITWKSETETNLKNYAVEYSRDGISYSAVSLVNGTGSGSRYSVAHSPAQGKVFYRIKSVDLDGRTQYTRAIILNVACGKNTVFVYPNPASNVLNINIASSQDLITQATLYDATGRKVITQNMKNGSNQMNVSNLSKGTYSLSLRSTSGVENMQILIK